MASTDKPKKFRLRRVGITSTSSLNSSVSNEVIQKNLEPLRENVQKKKRAQDAYYESHSDNFGVSPLTREANRRPVKHRLGRCDVSFTGTNASVVPAKHRLRKNNNTLNSNFKTRRNNIAQQRLFKIKQKQQEAVTDRFAATNNLKRPAIRNTEPKNFQVEVVNNPRQYVPRNNNSYRQRPRRFKQILMTEIQMEIKKMQQQFTGFNEQPSKITPETTLVTISDRFARLM